MNMTVNMVSIEQAHGKNIREYAASPAYVAQQWARWCGENKWTSAMRALDGEGRYVIWWGGYPQSKSAIPLCFQVFHSWHRPLTQGSRLRDLVSAHATLTRGE